EVITLSGAASAAQYADAIERITFENTTDSPSTVMRLVAVKVSDGNGDSNTAIATIDVTAVNDAPAGTDNTVTVNEDASRSFAAADFGFSDVDAGDTLSAVRIDTLTLPAGATLELNGTAVTAGQVILAAELGNLVFTPAPDANGAGYASFTFSVRDSGGLFDGTPNTLTVDVTPVA